MAYDLEEQEQLETLKAWWNKYGQIVTLAVTAAVLTFAGIQGWRWYQNSQAMQASILYGELEIAFQQENAALVRERTSVLTQRYASTPYAARAAMLSARISFHQKDLTHAASSSRWVIDNVKDVGMKDAARLNLAAVQLDQKLHDAALKTVEKPEAEAFRALFDEMRGDVLVAKGNLVEARAAYQKALANRKGDAATAQVLQLKYESVGGSHGK